MKALFLCGLALLLSPLAEAAVKYARIVRETPQGYELHPQAKRVDFSEAFLNFSPQRDGTPTDKTTFGAPRWLAVEIDEKTYIICVDNVPGVLSIHRAQKRGKLWVRTRGVRDIYHPQLYERLRAAGLNIHTAEELRNMSKEERQKALSGKDCPILHTECKK